MITRFGMAPRAQRTSVDALQAHWRTSHADAAGQIPNLVRYVQNHGVLDEGRYLLGYPGFDACSELDFESVEAMEEGFASETYRGLVRADEDAFVDKTRFSMMVGRGTTVAEGPETGVKLLTLLRAHPAAGLDGLTAALLGAYATAVVAGGRRHRIHVVELAAHHAIPAAFDAVDTLWFPTLEELLRFTASATWAEACWELSGRASGLVRLAAVPVTVR